MGWSLLGLHFLSLLVSLPKLWDCSERTYNNWYHRHLIILFSFFYFNSVVRLHGKLHYSAGSFFKYLSLGLVVWPRLGDLFYCQYSSECCTSHSPGQILGFAYTTWSHGRIKTSGKIPSGSPYPPSHVAVEYTDCTSAEG